MRDYALTAALFIVLGALAVYFDNRSAHEIGGVARVVDGDTLAIGTSRGAGGAAYRMIAGGRRARRWSRR
ncbi:hypothetical protein GTW25_04545 [Aliihoeflea aestuarii]|jgi:endonuclease YncB( thermonuclease family)|uniref:hypothetical protein n=1 Tax=Aliihoeflea aestuarii TaxID=453840 RepID=UPI002092A32E|nr:hypothetical protein [Aliihoeflea aestuarii]MCO6390294.1 hypothetical protein [Aliihoeflea aestuarii]